MQTWRTPEEIVQIAFQRSSVVMMNEAPSILGHDFIIDAYLLSIHNELE
jgi:hypothetical protein